MRLRVPVFILMAMAVASPGVQADDKEKHKEKDKKQPKHAQRNDDRDHDRDRDRDRDRRDDDRDGKITICHVPPGNASARHTITVGESAWAAHRGHGDSRGACGSDHPDRDDVFARLDRNDDGVLVLGEWPRDRVSFDRYDRDDNGQVTLREWLNPPTR